MRSHSLALVAALLVARTTHAQQTVPIRDLSAVDAKTPTHFGNIFGVRPLAGGKVLVNDGIRRQLVMLDANLANPIVVIDSVSEGGNSYGPRAAPLIPYLADSSLFVDGASLSLLVIDPAGKVAHVMAAPKPGDLRFLAGSASGVDAQGNLIYRAAMTINRSMMGPSGGTPGQPPALIQPPDSAPIVRANFETRMVDTIGRVKIQSGSRVSMTQDGNGKMEAKVTVNPLPTVDEWAVLSDGSIAFVRGHDYHIDWIRPDGKTASSAKLPFDWKRLTDDDKQKLIDSARTAMDKAAADAKAAGTNPMVAAMGSIAGAATGGAPGGGGAMEVRMVIQGGPGGGGGAGMSIGAPGPGGPGGPPSMQNFQMAAPKIEFVPIKEIADYYPAIRSGAAKADLDGNLWILPTTSAQSKAGELVYDVVNAKGELFQRVRLPVGRSIAGFGRKGIVYLMYRDGTTGWFLERTRVLTGTGITD